MDSFKIIDTKQIKSKAGKLLNIIVLYHPSGLVSDCFVSADTYNHILSRLDDPTFNINDYIYLQYDRVDRKVSFAIQYLNK